MSEALAWSPARSWRWRTCPRQFLYNDVIKAEPAQHDAKRLLRGQVMHAGMEAVMLAASNGRRRDALKLSAFLDDAREAMWAHPAAAALSLPDMADCLRIVNGALGVLDVPLRGSIIGIESPFSFHHNGILIAGVIDLVLRTGPTSLRILDWKSGKIPDRAESIEGNTALGVYSIAAMRGWRWATTIEVGLYSLPANRSVNLIVSREMQEMVLDRLARDYHAAQHARARLAPETVDEVYPAQEGEHCTSCVFRSYCPKFADSAPPTRPGVDVEAERERIATRISLSG